MRPKFLDIGLDKSGAFRRKRMIDRYLVLDLFGTNDEVQSPALARLHEVSFDIEVDEIAHADRCHQQDLDRDGHLSPHRPSLGISMPPSLEQQLLRER